MIFDLELEKVVEGMSVDANIESNMKFLFNNGDQKKNQSLFYLLPVVLLTVLLVSAFLFYNHREFFAKLDPEGHAKQVLHDVYQNDCSCRTGSLRLVDSSFTSGNGEKRITPVCVNLSDNNIVGVPDCEFLGEINDSK